MMSDYFTILNETFLKFGKWACIESTLDGQSDISGKRAPEAIKLTIHNCFLHVILQGPKPVY